MVTLRKLISGKETVSLISWDELSDAEKEDYEYESHGDCSFFRYKGSAYSMGDFFYLSDPHCLERLSGYVGGAAESAFSAVLVSEPDYREDTINVAYWAA